MPSKTKTPWYDHPLRIGALQCDFEGGRKQSLAVADVWRDMGMNTEQVFHPCADSYTALFDPQKHAALLRDYLAKLHRNEIRAILYLNVHIIGPSEADRHDEWAQRRADGSFPKLYDTYYATCYNSLWREHFLSVVDALADYPVDGIFLDGPVLTQGGCHCSHCRERHQEWFGTPMGDGPTSYAFNEKTLAMFIEETYRRFKQAHPEGIMYQNLGVEHARASFVDIRKALSFNDIVGTEGGFMFYGPPSKSWPFRPGFTARLLEAIAPSKPRVIFMAADQKSWSWYPHQPAETQACIASCAANGANVWYGLHGSTRLLNTPGGKAAADTFHFLHEHEARFEGTTSAADVAIFYSYETDSALNQATSVSDLYGAGGAPAESGLGDHKIAAKGFADMLIRGHIPFDIVTDLDLTADRLRRYRCIILPSVACMSDATAAVLDAYVRGGGHLIGTFVTSLFDEQGRPRKDLALADAFGVRSLGKITAYATFNYMRPRGRHPLLAGIEIPYLPMAGEALDIATNPDARAFLDYLQPLAGRYVPLPPVGHPAAVTHRHGRGSCLYLAGTFGEHYMQFMPVEYRRLILKAVRQWAKPVAEVAGADSPIEVVVRRQPGYLLVHLTNYCSFDGRPMERVEAIRDIQIRMRGMAAGRSARALVLNRTIRTRADAEGVTVTLPLLRGHETLVFKE